MQEPMDVFYLYSVRGLRTILKGGWGHNICWSAAPWSHGVCLSMTQLLPGMCLGCPPTLQQYLVMHQPQQDVPAYPWGATTGTEAVGAKECHMLSAQLRSLLEGRDMGKRDTAECSSLTFSSGWVFLYDKGWGASYTWLQDQSLPRGYSSPYLFCSQKIWKDY